MIAPIPFFPDTITIVFNMEAMNGRRLKDGTERGWLPWATDKYR
jgi:hypothetical protein